MPKRLSDITHAFERATEALEDAQDRLTQATEAARVRVDCAAKDRHQAYDALYAYLRDHGDEVVIAGDWAYRQERGQIARQKIVWAHHVTVSDPPAEVRTSMHTYRIPPSTDYAIRAAMATAWGNMEPELDGEPNPLEPVEIVADE